MTETTFERGKKKPGLVRVHPGHPVMGRPAGSTGFCRVVAPAGLLTNPNRSMSRVSRLPDRPAGPDQV